MEFDWFTQSSMTKDETNQGNIHMSIKKELVPKSPPMLVQCVHYGNIAKHILNRKVLVRKFQGD